MMISAQDLPPSAEWILKDNDRILFNKCEEITFPLKKEDKLLIDRMVKYIDACYDNKYEQLKIAPGIAIAGPQVGLSKNVIYIHFRWQEEYKFLLANPKIIFTSKQKCYLKHGEGCLSVNSIHPGHVVRANEIKISAIDMLNENKETIISASGILAICFQHEIDHLSGILYYHKINKQQPFVNQNDNFLLSY